MNIKDVLGEIMDGQLFWKSLASCRNVSDICQHLVKCRHLDFFLSSYTHPTAPSETKCRQREKQEAQESPDEQSDFD